jgi:hypothetical protein
MAFVFMSVPLFNLIVVNERAVLGGSFSYDADTYMENIIRRGAQRCFVFQWTVLLTGIGILFTGPLGLGALWGNWVLLVKTLLVIALMGLLSFVHFRLQPAIDGILAEATPDASIPDDLPARLKPHRVLRKRLATVCLFLVIVAIILGMQVYVRFALGLNVGLIALAAVFAARANRTLVRFGWL